ncbi:MAG TPA: TIGR02757 family protein, partial [Acidobacteriota bacterium]|nr:TIGR02757 family protein [Acidobacteriota bacterium]
MPAVLTGRRQTALKQVLDELVDSYVRDFERSPERFFAKRRDPIQFPHRYREFHDVEAAAFLAATFAYGNVTSLCAFIERLLARLGPSPAAFLRKGPAAVESLVEHQPYYRLHKSDEILAVIRMLSRVYTRHDSLYQVFLAVYDEDSTMLVTETRFVERLRQIAETPLRFLVPSPEDGSTCKRLNLFFRWMIRREGIDFGLWRNVPPSILIMPVDTHIGRIAYRLGWVKT